LGAVLAATIIDEPLVESIIFALVPWIDKVLLIVQWSIEIGTMGNTFELHDHLQMYHSSIPQEGHVSP